MAINEIKSKVQLFLAHLLVPLALDGQLRFCLAGASILGLSLIISPSIGKAEIIREEVDVGFLD